MPAPPFYRTGVDFAGPFVIKQGHTRRPVLLKCYAAVFVCLTTKAVHLDLCPSLSTADFLAILRRFVARCGCPADVYCDNGTNFVGAREEIRELQRLSESKETKQAVSHFSHENGISWHHITPRAPHFGGLWEAAVKAMKTALKKNLQPHALRLDELYPILVDAEAMLNSRPIAPIHTQEAQEGGYLTAGHFLIGSPLRAPPTAQPPAGKMSNLRRWNLVSRVRTNIWRQWLATYLATHAQRSKWTRPGLQLRIGDLVFVKDDSLKDRTWPLARITEVFPGTDGQVRAAKLKCHNKEFPRATALLIPFSLDEPTSADPGNLSGTP